MNINKVLVLTGILFASVLIIENMVVPLQAYVFIWVTKSYVLAFFSIVTGILIGYGFHGMMNSSSKETDSEDFDF